MTRLKRFFPASRAEMASGVTYHCGAQDQPLKVFWAMRESLSGVLQRAHADDPDAAGCVSLGPPIPGVSLRIVDDGEKGRLPFTRCCLSRSRR